MDVVKDRILYIPLFLMLSVSSTYALEHNDSIDMYMNQTVDSEVDIQGRGLLTTANVHVTSTGSLKLSAPQGVTVTGPYTVDLGGKLEINGGRQYYVKFLYNTVGHRVRREKEEIE